MDTNEINNKKNTELIAESRISYLQEKKHLLVVFGKYNQRWIIYTYKVVYDGLLLSKFGYFSRIAKYVYEDKSLCLYYPPEHPWRCGKSSLYSHIIPWIHEWILFYEIWKITGIWGYPEVNHGETHKV